MSKQFRTCEHCGANLDPDEKCDCRESNNNMIWKVTSLLKDLVPLYIKASSFDEAIAKARKIDPSYSGGQVMDERNY